MASYEDTVVAAGPVWYARLDELSGSIMTARIGPDGTYYPDCVFGLASPIETNPSSRAVGGRVGQVSATDGGPLDVVTASTVGGWILYRNDYLSQTATLLCRDAQWGVLGGFTDLTESSTLVHNRYYFLIGTHSGNVMRLYLNGVLVAERTDLVALDEYPRHVIGINNNHFQYSVRQRNATNPPWLVGVSGSGNVWSALGVDEPFIFDFALTAAQIKGIYESALNLLPVSVTFGARATLELDTDAIIPVDYPFLHNFADPLEGTPRPVIETLSFKTHVNQSEPDYQQRINAQPHHVDRTLEYAFTATEKLGRSRLNSALWRPAECYKLPVSIDWTVLTAQASSGANTLSLDTTLRDFEIGSYCVAWTDSFDATTYQFFKITSITDTEFGISPNVGTTLPIGSGVAPARIACLEGESDDIDSHAIDRETDLLRFTILSTELSTRRFTTYVPSSIYKSIEIFSLEKAQVSWLNPRKVTRRRRIEGTEIPGGNDYYRSLDTGSPGSVPISLTLTSRSARADFYGWLNARQGKQNPVWISSNENDLTFISSPGSGVIKVTSSRYKASYNLHYGRRDVQLVYTNGTVSNNRIVAAVDNGDGTENLTLSPGQSSTIAKISFLRLCTAPDNFELKHYNNPRDPDTMVTQCDFVFTELLTTPV